MREERSSISNFRRLRKLVAGKTTSIRGARVTLLCAILTFFFIQIGFVGLIRSWNPQPAYDPEYAHKLVKLREHLSHRDDTGKLLLVLGSSRVATGFHPEVLPAMQTAGLPKLHIFNFGICQWVH